MQHLVRDLLCFSKDIRFNATEWHHLLHFGIHFYIPVFPVHPKCNMPSWSAVCIRYSVFSHSGLGIGLKAHYFLCQFVAVQVML